MIEKMPFMSFNRENLTAIAILLDYFSIEISKKEFLAEENELLLVEDESFQYEFERMKYLYKKFDVNSILLVLRINNELQATRVYEKIQKMLRSLDMVTLVINNDFYYITLLFPLHDKAAALGYLNRLLFSIEEEKDKKFNYMTFDLTKTELLNKYYKEDYDE
ncbi:MAG: PelD GGDEF domain-containing protein [Sulfurimonas sp.]|nr:PelD GGDEF domain-containing protein [Sulfurimonas sp.]